MYYRTLPFTNEVSALRFPRPSLASCTRAGPARLLLDVHTASLVAESTTVSVDALGGDIFTFLAASVLVVPLSRLIDVTPVLGFLVLGCAIGPYGLGFFSNSEADLQLGARECSSNLGPVDLHRTCPARLRC